MPRASAAAAEQTALDVLHSATELFATRGFAEVSLADVAQAAGVTRGAVYHHYGNKVGLFRAVAARLQSTVAEAVVTLAEQEGDDARRQLRAGCHAFLDAITAAPVVRVLLIDAPAVIGWAGWRDLDAENSEAHLREALAAVDVAGDLVDALTTLLSGAMNEAALWIAQNPGREDHRTESHRALDLILDAVLG